MIVATSFFPRTLLRVLLVSLVLWPGGSLAQFAPAEPAEEQAPPLTEEQALARIKVQLEREHTAEAIQLIERFLDQSDTPVFIEQFSFLYAIALEAEGQFNQAVTILEQFLEEFPGSTLAHDARLRLGTLYTELQQPNRAVSILSRILDLSSDETLRAEALYRLCLAYESNGEYLRAIETALHHAEQSGADKRRDLLDYVQHLILEKMSEPSLGEIIDAFPGTSPGDLALIRLIEFHKSRDDDTLAETGHPRLSSTLSRSSLCPDRDRASADRHCRNQSPSPRDCGDVAFLGKNETLWNRDVQRHPIGSGRG